MNRGVWFSWDATWEDDWRRLARLFPSTIHTRRAGSTTDSYKVSSLGSTPRSRTRRQMRKLPRWVVWLAIVPWVTVLLLAMKLLGA